MAQDRIERDSLGPMPVPADALYAAQTARAVDNFPISGWPMPAEFIAAVARIKRAAAAVHKAAGRITPDLADAIAQAAGEIIEGRHRGQFPVDVFQTGSGTSTNMNVNEVIAARAAQLTGAAVHANDHVNMGQSSNDVIPTAIHLAAAMAIHDRLVPALRALSEAIKLKAAAFDSVLKIGRTHLMDAVPMRLGQEFSGFAAQIDACLTGLQAATAGLCEVALGGTAVGTGLNAPAGFAAAVCKILAAEAHLPIHEAGNHFAAQSAPAGALAASGTLRSTALAMGRVASDIRLLASGPRCGLAELRLPALQPGSSIMPGKVNPVICESVIQVACQVVGCDAAIAAGATGGVGSILQLNVAMPLIASNLLTAINLLTNAAKVFAEKCIAGIEADESRCRQSLEQSLAMVTALVPRIGYDAAAAIAKQASASGKTVRQVCLENKILPPDELDKLLDPVTQAGQ
ncbi:MAG: class II fumarate hydratase [Planctomycetaceae bacterium]|nr:class II fumarate hydratase [Planctomycetaceae bacterium]